MTRKEAIKVLNMVEAHGLADEAKRMAIEALQFVEHFDLLKEFQSLQEVVMCKDCRHQEHCHETVAHTKRHKDCIEYWSETIKWCSRGERKGK